MLFASAFYSSLLCLWYNFFIPYSFFYCLITFFFSLWVYASWSMVRSDVAGEVFLMAKNLRLLSVVSPDCVPRIFLVREMEWEQCAILNMHSAFCSMINFWNIAATALGFVVQDLQCLLGTSGCVGSLCQENHELPCRRVTSVFSCAAIFIWFQSWVENFCKDRIKWHLALNVSECDVPKS